MKKFFVGIIALVIVAGVSAEAATTIYTDKLGRVINIPVPVERAVFFQTYELLPALDIWDKVVGIGTFAYDNDLMKAVKPDVNKIPSAGSGTDVNIEAVLKLKPDIVITWTWKPGVIRFMEEKGLRVIGIYPESLAELNEVMRLHGRMFNREKKIDSAISEMERIFSAIKKKTSSIPTNKKKKVLWLGGKQTSVACGIGITNDVFKMIGGINVAGHIPQRNADVSIEQIIAWNPDVIFIWGNAKYNKEDILRNPQWRHIKAVKDGMVFKSPQWSTWSPRIAPISLWMAAKTYPEYFKDIDREKIIDIFYRKVFGIPYGKVRQIED